MNTHPPPNRDLLNKDDLVDILMDLKHDLGKYILLPLSMLPKTAGQLEIEDALRNALQATRQGPTGTTTAREIWHSFQREVGEELSKSVSFLQLHKSVEEFLGLEYFIGGQKKWNQQELIFKAKTISEQIWLVVEEINQ